MVSVWTVITVLLWPIGVGAFWLLWGRTTELWGAHDQVSKDFANFRVYVAEKYVAGPALDALKKDLETRLDRLDERLERALKGGTHG